MEKIYWVRLTVVAKDVNAETDHYTFKDVHITFKLKNCFTCDSLNRIYVVICDICKEECTGENGEGKTKLKDKVRVYRKLIRQP